MCLFNLCLAAIFAVGGLVAEKPLLPHGEMVHANGVELWNETFGDKNNPAVLLIMGGGGQGILWPTEFCQKLADEGFYVIRYDHRDAGLSTAIDFEKNPYTMKDLADDAIGLLDALQIQKAHVFGVSMGGFIAPIMAVDYPDRVLSIGLLATTCDFRPAISELFKKPVEIEENSLSYPTPEYLASTLNLLKAPANTFEELLQQRLETWKLLNGSAAPFDEKMNTEIQTEFMLRNLHPKSLESHLSSMALSLDMIQTTPAKVRVPTVVLQGSDDPIFRPDHGETLAALIPGARYVLIKGMGHIPNAEFYDLWIQEIKNNAIKQ